MKNLTSFLFFDTLNPKFNRFSPKYSLFCPVQEIKPYKFYIFSGRKNYIQRTGGRNDQENTRMPEEWHKSVKKLTRNQLI